MLRKTRRLYIDTVCFNDFKNQVNQAKGLSSAKLVSRQRCFDSTSLLSSVGAFICEEVYEEIIYIHGSTTDE